MALSMETPSRIWRRIEEDDAYAAEMPSLPSLPGIDETSNDDHSFEASSSSEPTVHRLNVSRTPIRYLSSSQSSARDARHRILEEARLTSEKDVLVSTQKSSVQLNGGDEGLSSNSSNHGTQDNCTGRPRSSDLISLRSPPEGSINEDEDDSLADALRSVSRSPSPIPKPVLDSTFDIVNGGNDSTRTGSTISPLKPFEYRDFKGVAIRKRYPVGQLTPLSQETSSASSIYSPHPPNTGTVAEQRQGTRPLEIRKIGGIQTEESHTTDQFHEGITSVTIRGINQEDLTRDHGAGSTSHSTSYPTPAELSPVGSNHTPSLQSHIQHTSDFNVAEGDDLATPLPRRKSFLLSVVNSTSRPRLSFQTPRYRASRQSLGVMDFTSNASLKDTGKLAPLTPVAENGNNSDTSLSVASTTSSHDLVFHRANASFDPVTGPQGIGRFDAGRLNSYLHGLNRRLQEENEYLSRKVKDQQQEIDSINDHIHQKELSSVQEEEEGWILEKEELERKVDELNKIIELKGLEIEGEREERARDKERWRARMVEVEEGVSIIVKDLENRLEDAEKKATKLEIDAKAGLDTANINLEQALAECQQLKERAKRAEDIMTEGKDLGIDLRVANERIAELERELRMISYDLQRKEGSLESLRAASDSKEAEIDSLRGRVRDLESQLQDSDKRRNVLQEEMDTALRDHDRVKRELSDAKAAISKYEAKATEMTSDKTSLLRRLSEAEDKCRYYEKGLRNAEQQVALANDETSNFRKMVEELEHALEDSDKKIICDGREILDLRARISLLEQDREKSKLDERSRSQHNFADTASPETLRLELDAANREIGNLKTQLAQSPSRKALEKAKEARIELLEKENEQLMNQLRSSRDLPSYSATPRREPSMNGLTPLHKQLINLSLRAPKTPGEPLKDLSWLMSMTGDVVTENLLEEIGRLQRKLDKANESIDNKIDKLEEAGLGVVGHSEALTDTRVLKLEAELKRIQREADHYGKDLRQLRSERDDLLYHHHKELERCERIIKQNRSHIRLLKEQINSQHKLQAPSDNNRLGMELLRSSHRKECKGLFAQIRYLKAKFTREASLRENLVYQKQYFLVLLSRYEKSEKRILATIAQMGPSATPTCRQGRSLKAVGYAIIFFIRTRRASDSWRNQRSSREAINDALELVRKRRLNNA